MNDTEFSSMNARIKRLERHNLILKIIGFAGLLFLAFNFGTGKNSVEETQIKAQKFVLMDEQGKECGYLGYDNEWKSPRLFLTDCGTNRERIDLNVRNYIPALILRGAASTAILQGGSEDKQAILSLQADYAGATSLQSGSRQSTPQLLLDGKEKGVVQLFADGEFFKIYDNDKNRRRFSIKKNEEDAVALYFFDKAGKENYRVPAKPSETR